jgi:hypothetical protein
MTLILGLANQQQVILISDRRLSANGKVVEDESNKATTFNLQDARIHGPRANGHLSNETMVTGSAAGVGQPRLPNGADNKTFLQSRYSELCRNRRA